MTTPQPVAGTPAYFRWVGRAGGLATVRRYGRPHFSEIGRQGGLALRDTHGLEYYRDMGRRSGLARRSARARAAP